MPPEQAVVEKSEIGPAVDLSATGAIASAIPVGEPSRWTAA